MNDQSPPLAQARLPGFEPGDTISSFGPKGLKGNAWVLRNKTTGEALNAAKYEAVPVGQHLAELNYRLRGAKGV